MLRLPHDKRTRIHLTLVAAFLLAFYFGVRYAANWIEGGADFLELQDAITRGDFGETPVYFAVESGNVEILKMLADRGADVSIATHAGGTPLALEVD